MIKHLTVIIYLSLCTAVLSAQSLPVPDHIVILFLEDKDYTEIVGDTNLPYINSLINDTSAALFTQSYCTFTGYSQPNYLDFYSGYNQGVTNNLVPSNHPFTTDNLGRQLLDSGKTFVTYAEDLPYAGYNGPSWGAYVRKHNPVTNWMGTGINQVPDTLNQPFTAYPSWNFNLLPTVTYVVPNNINNMHDGNYPTNFQIADAWIQSNLDSYIQWAKSNNSLFILTFDEGNFTNRIVTVFLGPMVQGGQYHDTINHFNILRTIEEMYGLGYAGNAAYVQPVTWCWKTSGIKENAFQEKISLHPNPVSDVLTLRGNIFSSYEMHIRIIDMAGRTFMEKHFSKMPDHTVTLHTGKLETGMYIVEARCSSKTYRIKMLKD